MPNSRELSCGVHPRWSGIISLLLAGGIAFVAWRDARPDRLRRGGAAVCGCLALVDGWTGGLFYRLFVSSTLLSRFRAPTERREPAACGHGRSPRRRAGVANGGVFTAVAAAHWASPNPLWKALGAGACRLGRRNRGHGDWTLARADAAVDSRVAAGARGTSGGVMARGLACVGGAASSPSSPGCAVACGVDPAALIGGLFGAYSTRCSGGTPGPPLVSACSAATEQRVHRCGTGRR